MPLPLNFHALFIKCEHLHYISKYLDENLKKKKNLNPWANFEEIQLVPNSHQEIAVLDSLIDKTELCELWYLEEY